MVSPLLTLSVLCVNLGFASYASMTCYGDGGYVNAHGGTFNNIQSSYFMNGIADSIYSDGDRRWKFRYCKPVNANPTFTSTFATTPTYGWGEWPRDCLSTSSHSAMIGGTSDFDAMDDDRKWTWHCGRLDTNKYLLSDCADTGYVGGGTNNKQFSYHCPNNGVIRKIYNENGLGAPNYYQFLPDRIWGFVCCRIHQQPTPSPTDKPTPSPAVNPTVPPTPNPTYDPTHNPTALPTYIPTVVPSSNPTIEPTSDPTHNPTTLAPSKPGTLTCDGHSVGAYNNEALSFTVRMPFVGDLTFDASHSDFSITSMSAVFFPNIPISGAHVNGVMTLTDTVIIGDYVFTIMGGDGVYDQFDVRVTCTSDRPTAAPTQAPTDTPTNEPTAAPSMSPTGVPTVIPTSDPSIAPSRAPTASPMERLMVQPPSKPPTQRQSEVEVVSEIRTTQYLVIERSEMGDEANNDDRETKGTLTTNWVVIILLAMSLMVCCIVVGMMLCRGKKRTADQGDDTIDIFVQKLDPSSVRMAPGEGNGSQTYAMAVPGQTELVSMVTNDGGEGAKRNIVEDSEEDSSVEDLFLKQKTTAQGKTVTEDDILLDSDNSSVEDMFLKQKTTVQGKTLPKTTDIGHAVDMICDNNEENQLLGNGVSTAYVEKEKDDCSSSDDVANDPLYGRKGTETKGASK